jgi:serine phosphatase RsbU (regulator of sigma subunit)
MTPDNWCITQDSRGVMYAGNANGVLEYDGSNWNFIPVKDGAYVTALLATDDGTLYVGTSGSFGKLTASTTGKLHYQEIYPAGEKDPVSFGPVWSIQQNEKSVIFQTDEFIGFLNNNKVLVTSSQEGFHVLLQHKNNLYVRERNIGLFQIQGSELKQVSNHSFFASNGVFGMIPYKNDSLLLVTHDSGLYITSTSFSNPLPFKNSASAELTGAMVYRTVSLLHGEFGLATSRKGLIILNSHGEITNIIDKSSGLRVSEVKDVFQDREENLWIALQNGISHVNYYSPLSYFDEETGISGNVQAVIRYRNQLYIGSSSGLFTSRTDSEKNTSIFFQVQSISSLVWDFAVCGNHLAIGTGDGVFIWDGNTYRKILDKNANALVYMPKINQLLVAGNRGIYILECTGWTLVTEVDGANNGVLDATASPSPIKGDEEIWIGLFNQGVIRANYINNQWSFDAYDSFDGLYENVWVRPSIIDNQVIFGSVGSALKFIDENVVNADLPDSLKNDPMYARGFFDAFDMDGKFPLSTTQLITEAIDRIWICQENQLSYLDKNKDLTSVKHPFWGINFGRFNTFYLEENGDLWCGTADGLIRFSENKRKKYGTAFNTLIRNVTIGGTAVFEGAWFSNRLPVPGQPENLVKTFPFSENTVSFQYSAPYFEDNHKVLYSYKLDNYDETWSEWTTETKAVYTNLHEGEYVFRVKARNVYLHESTEAVYSFEILSPWYRTVWAYIGYGITLILLILVAIRISSARLRAQNARLERIVTERTAEIAAQNVELEHQKDEILHQKTEIEDSINYAKRIQEAILPMAEEIQQNLLDSFVLFKPKDIVSGDFYWFGISGDDKVLVCADCTGHGVPGAFMSMIGSDKLNQAVKQEKLTNPNGILQYMNRGIKSSLKQDETKETTRDGMDAAILCFKSNGDVQYAGANRPLWLIRNGELTEYTATKSAVGGFTEDSQEYELHTIHTQPGDRLYTTTDGYADQFGGTGGKKLKVKTLKEYLLEIHLLPMEEQKHLLNQKFENWKRATSEDGTLQEFEQIDDVCIIGVRV